jgi:hypothetical protein
MRILLFESVFYEGANKDFCETGFDELIFCGRHICV